VSNPFRPLSSIPGANVIGIAQANLESAYPNNFLIFNISHLNEAAYIALLDAARREFTGFIDIVDISYVFNRSETRDGQYFYLYTAAGKVVSIDSNRIDSAVGVEGALERAASDVSENFTARSRIAVVYITAQDRSITEYITGELEHILRRQGFIIVDRGELDRIRAEQRFGVTLEVDDTTAARIGHIAGAGIVITGRVDGEGNLRRLRLRALDTTTAQVIGTASERI
jgi:hypothetical protein